MKYHRNYESKEQTKSIQETSTNTCLVLLASNANNQDFQILNKPIDEHFDQSEADSKRKFTKKDDIPLGPLIKLTCFLTQSSYVIWVTR